MTAKSISAILRLLLIVVGGLVLSQIIALGIAYSYGYTLETIREMGDEFMEKVDAGFIRASLMSGHLFTFIIPSLLFAQLYYQNRKWAELRLDKKLSIRVLGIAFLFLVVSYPVVTYSYTVNSWIPLAEWMHSNEDATAATLAKVLEMDNVGMLLFNILLVALTPAIGEELLFRGLLQGLIEKGSGKGHLAVWIAAIVFSFFHLQFEGFLPRLLLGLVLGYSYLWSRNLWIPIFLHFFNNAIPILSLYFLNNDLAATDPASAAQLPWYTGLISLLLAIGLGYYFSKNKYENERA